MRYSFERYCNKQDLLHESWDKWLPWNWGKSWTDRQLAKLKKTREDERKGIVPPKVDYDTADLWDVSQKRNRQKDFEGGTFDPITTFNNRRLDRLLNVWNRLFPDDMVKASETWQWISNDEGELDKAAQLGRQIIMIDPDNPIKHRLGIVEDRLNRLREGKPKAASVKMSALEMSEKAWHLHQAGKSAEDIASELGRSVATVKKYLADAKRRNTPGIKGVVDASGKRRSVRGK